eukprot:TRINITY_DN5606_c0_g1_i1.p1 TRINITY_DN5606_c0_g1~~TRINITY_DN5606_c0_g1_i1.p1  ORF type:complete len:365 (-),score=60.06 TRINITY_DN5606_c0_g1_i1:21-1115(-)
MRGCCSKPRGYSGAAQDSENVDEGCVLGTHYEATRWMNLDACGIICALVSWGLLLYATVVTVGAVIKPWKCTSAMKVIGSLAFVTVAALALVAHARTMLTDPGAVPRDVAPPGGEGDEEEGETAALNAELDSENRGGEREKAGLKRWCRRCDAYKPLRAHHCSICARCIIKMDHHCPWVNNCVGLGNHKLFLLFIGYTAVLCILSIGILVYKVVLEDAKRLPKQCQMTPSDQVAAMSVGIIALLFGLFTTCMLLDQCSSLESGLTKIDRLKGETHASHGRTVALGVNEVWGGEEQWCRWHWLCPWPASWPAAAHALLNGYERSCGRSKCADADDHFTPASFSPKHGNPKGEDDDGVEMLDMDML